MNGTKAFTLIELLVVVLIIGILAAVAVPQYQKAIWKSRILEQRVYAQKLMDAFDMYELNGGEYPNGTFHGTANKDLFETLAIDFPDKVYQSMNTSFTPQSSVGNKNYPVYVQWFVKYPDFGVCVYLTPNVGAARYRKITCGSTTAFGDKICSGICGTPMVSSGCGSFTKHCYL